MLQKAGSPSRRRKAKHHKTSDDKGDPDEREPHGDSTPAPDTQSPQHTILLVTKPSSRSSDDQLPHPTDEELMREFYRGHEESYEELVRRYLPKVKRWALRYRKLDPEDVAQTTFVKVYETAPHVRAVKAARRTAARADQHTQEAAAEKHALHHEHHDEHEPLPDEHAHAGRADGGDAPHGQDPANGQFDTTRRFAPWLRAVMKHAGLDLLAHEHDHVGVDTHHAAGEPDDVETHIFVGEIVALDTLTPAQREVLEGLRAGKSKSDIARERHCHPNAVDNVLEAGARKVRHAAHPHVKK